jgi:cytochrome c oxidase subunit III
MTAAPVHVAHHFDDAQQQYAAAGIGMWLFLATEVLFFGGMFAGYALYRLWYPAAFAVGSHHLDIVLGTINTGVLLTSSLTMALAVRATQTGDRQAAAKFLAWTMLLGTTFLCIKGYEYYHKFEEHLVPGRHFALEGDPLSAGPQPFSGNWMPVHPDGEIDSNHVQLFFSFYFAMTAVHATHMIIGICILGVLWVATRRGRFSAAYFTPVEMTGLYWHFVDIIWVFLFPLLYLIH